ncbi:MAG: amidohydrolase family protein [Brevinema sp.]
MYSYLIKNASLIDPQSKKVEIKDLAITDHKITRIASDIKSAAQHTIDATGLYLTPGLIDAHTHCYLTTGIPQAWAGDFAIQADAFSFRNGCTTMIDTGSSGSLNFSHFKATVIERVKTRIFALLNIADWGMNTLLTEQFPELFNIDTCIKVAQQYSEIVGIKIAHYWDTGWDHVDIGLKVGEVTNLPLMVDFGRFKKERPTHKLLERLRKGDILTHCYRAPVPVINSKGEVFSYLRKARKKGILFDLGHGQGSFLFRNAHPAIQQDFKPDFVSTDIHGTSMNECCQDLLTVMSKCLAMGMSFEEIIRATTINPAKAFSLPDGIGTLVEGGIADIALFSIQEGHYAYKDICNGVVPAKQRIFCEMTFRNGELVWDYNARCGVPYQNLPPLCGIDPNYEEYTPPMED